MTPELARIERVCALLLALLLVVPFALMPLVPTHDGFQHLLHGYLWNHLDDPGRGYATFLERGSPITAWGFTWLFAPIEPLLGWQAAYQAVLALIALGNALGVRALINAVARKPSPLGLLGFAVGLSWPLYMGFLPFLAAQAVGLGVLAFALRRPKLSGVDHMVVATGLLLCAMMHVFPAVLAGGALLVLRTAAAERGERAKTAALTALSGLPAAMVAAIAFGAGADNIDSQAVAGENRAMWQAWGTRIADLGRTSVSGPPWRWGPVLAAAIAGPIFALRHRRALPTAAGALGVAGLVLALVAPFHMSAWESFAPRPLIFALTLGVAALASLPMPRPRLVLAVVTAFAALSVGWGHLHSAGLARESRQALARLDAVERSDWRLPLVFDSRELDRGVPNAKPYANLGHLYVIEQGGMVPYVFASSPRIHQHLFRAEARRVPVPERSYFDAPLTLADSPDHLRALRTALLSNAPAFEDVTVYGDEATIELLEPRGFVIDHRSSNLAIARFEGCAFEVGVHAEEVAETIDAPLVTWGWFPVLEATGSARAAGHPIATAELSSAPCGDVWIRVQAENADGPVRCRGADPDGRFVLRLDAAPPGPVPCYLEQR